MFIFVYQVISAYLARKCLGFSSSPIFYWKYRLGKYCSVRRKFSDFFQVLHSLIKDMIVIYKKYNPMIIGLSRLYISFSRADV